MSPLRSLASFNALMYETVAVLAMDAGEDDVDG
jgi:hypothetical protein